MVNHAVVITFSNTMDYKSVGLRNCRYLNPSNTISAVTTLH